MCKNVILRAEPYDREAGKIFMVETCPQDS